MFQKANTSPNYHYYYFLVVNPKNVKIYKKRRHLFGYCFFVEIMVMGNILDRHSSSSPSLSSKPIAQNEMKTDSKSIPATTTKITKSNMKRRSMSDDNKRNLMNNIDMKQLFPNLNNDNHHQQLQQTIEKFQKEIDELQQQFDRLNYLENKQRRNTLPRNRTDYHHTNNNNDLSIFQKQINELERQLTMLNNSKD